MLLDKVSPASDDDIYVLGDLVDRGPKITQVLKWAIENASDSIHFLIGNHEDMFASYLEYGYWHHPWNLNTNAKVRKQIFHQGYKKWYYSTVLQWITNLPLFYDIDINGVRHILVHAGIRYSDNDVAINGIQEIGSRQEIVTISGFGRQHAQDLMWIREGWIDRSVDDGIVFICGHTPFLSNEVLSEVNGSLNDFGLGKEAQPGHVNKIGSRYFIDCGISHISDYPNTADLAMLRLEDKQVFYLNKPDEVVE